MKKILIVLTNVNKFPTTHEATGLWLAEATEFVSEVQKAGYQVDYVSPLGGYVPIDPRSLKAFYADNEAFEIYSSADFQRRALSHSLHPEQVKPEEYAAIYYTGGHGVIFDFPDNQELQDIAEKIYQGGGYVTSVCHGVCGLLNLKTSDDEFLIAHKTLTGFTQLEEILSGKNRHVPFGTERESKKRGAHFVKKHPFASFAVQDGQLITGQNPRSGRAVAKLLLKNLE